MTLKILADTRNQLKTYLKPIKRGIVVFSMLKNDDFKPILIECHQNWYQITSSNDASHQKIYLNDTLDHC